MESTKNGLCTGGSGKLAEQTSGTGATARNISAKQNDHPVRMRVCVCVWSAEMSRASYTADGFDTWAIVRCIVFKFVNRLNR